MKRSSGRWAPIALAALLLLAASVGLARWLSPRTVETVTLERRDVVRTLVVAGSVRAPGRAGLGASIPGIVMEVGVREGDRVSTGDLVVRLDDREATAAVREARAVLAEALAGSRSAVEQAEEELEAATRDLGRIRAVFDEGGLTRQQLESAERRVADARSRLDAVLAPVDGSVLAPTGDPAGGHPEPAAVTRARHSLEVAEARLALTRVLAPSDGVVLSRRAEAGDAVQPGQVLVELLLHGPPEVVAFPAEENLAGLVPGVRARVSADAYPDEVLSAQLSWVAPAVDPTQGTVEVRLAFEDPPAFLRPDMTLSVNLEVGVRPDTRVLPAGAVMGLATASPWVAVAPGGRVERREVSVGLRGEGFVEILGGIEEGEEVLLAEDGLEPGVRVRVRR